MGEGGRSQESAACMRILLRAQGDQQANDGSFKSTVHCAIVSVRSLFDRLGESVLPGLINGGGKECAALRQGVDLLKDK